MLALLPQTAPAQAENTGEYDRAEFVSLTPQSLWEVEPCDYLQNPEALNEAQLFYAKPETDSEGKIHPSSLLGSLLTLVSPYKHVERQELPTNTVVFCKGRLDNLILTAQGYWSRPSTSFFSIAWPQELKEGKLKLDFTRYRSDLKDANAYEKRMAAAPAPLDDLLRIQLSPPSGNNASCDFRECPWMDMLEKRIAPEPVVNGDSLDQPFVDELCERLDKGKVRKWPTTWLASTYGVENRKPRYRSAFKPRWTFNSMYPLNASQACHDGWLALRDYPYHEWDFAKISPLSSLPQTASAAPKTSARETVGESRVPGGIWHFVPVSGVVSHYDTQTGKIDESKGQALGKAVVASPAEQMCRPAFVLAIAANWAQDSCTDDALSLNQDFQWKGGHTKPVRVPEYTQVDVFTHKAGSKYSLKPGLNVTIGDDKKVEFQWEGGVVEIKNNIPQSPIAYPAYLNRFTWKAVVALPADMGDENTWKVSVRRAESAGLLKYDKYSDGSSPRADWLPSTPYNLSTDMDEARMQLKPIPMTDKGKPVDFVCLAADSDNNTRETVYSEGEKYKLYELTVTSSDVPEEFHYIQSGEMHNAWVFSSNEKTCAPAATIVQKVYTIFGSSTWQSSGLVSDCKHDTGTQVLPWEELLNVLTRGWLCDANTMRIVYTSDNANNLDMEQTVDPMAFGVRNTYNYGSSEQNVVYLDSKQYETIIKMSNATGNSASLITNFPNEWTMLTDEDEFAEKLPRNTVGFRGCDRYGNKAVLVSCLMKQLVINDVQVINNEVNRSFTLFDLGEFCKMAPKSMAINCINCSSALSTIPRICGLPAVIDATSALVLVGDKTGNIKVSETPHSYNMYANGKKIIAIDATCSSIDDNTRRWLHNGNYTDEDYTYKRNPRIFYKRENELLETYSFITKKEIYLYPISEIKIK